MTSMARHVKEMSSQRHSIGPQVTLCGPTCCPDGLDEAQASQMAEIFAALGDPARLRIYSMIAGTTEICSCALEVPLGRSQSTVSHHTSKLAQAGLIVGERRGRWTWWRVVPQMAQKFGMDGFLAPVHRTPDGPWQDRTDP